jgi:hypothetical protein
MNIIVADKVGSLKEGNMGPPGPFSSLYGSRYSIWLQLEDMFSP